MIQSTVLLVFAQPVAHDAARKRLSVSYPAGRRLIAALNERTWQTARATGLPVRFSAQVSPHIGTFGQQLSRALEAVFAEGFERVVVVGNDCPALTAQHLTTAAAHLQAGRIVLGPDRRGGVYLLGLSRAQFNADRLAQLPWQTDQLRQAIQAWFGSDQAHSLPALGDINSAADLLTYRSDSARTLLLVKQLQRLLHAVLAVPGPAPVSADPRQLNGSTASLRAPPVY